MRLAPVTETRVDDADVRRQLAARDYLEALDFAFVDAGLLARWNMAEGAVTLANPLSAELGVMRTWLLPGLVDALGRTVARQQSRVRLFEVGKVFGSREPGAGSREAGAPVETLRVAGGVCGLASSGEWRSVEET